LDLEEQVSVDLPANQNVASGDPEAPILLKTAGIPAEYEELILQRLGLEEIRDPLFPAQGEGLIAQRFGLDEVEDSLFRAQGKGLLSANEAGSSPNKIVAGTTFARPLPLYSEQFICEAGNPESGLLWDFSDDAGSACEMGLPDRHEAIAFGTCGPLGAIFLRLVDEGTAGTQPDSPAWDVGVTSVLSYVGVTSVLSYTGRSEASTDCRERQAVSWPARRQSEMDIVDARQRGVLSA
jgi:hypothetical protein